MVYYENKTNQPFGLNAEQKYLNHLQNVIHVYDIYKLVEADTEYIDLFARHKIEEVEGWGCRLMFTRPKPGIDHKIDLSVHNAGSGFKRTVDIAFVDIPCRIDKTYYDNVHSTRWVDAIGSMEKVGEIETQVKDNISTEITEDINVEVEKAFSTVSNYRKDDTSFDKVKQVALKEIEPKGNYYEISKVDANDMDTIINFFFSISARFKKRNTIFQKGYI